MLEIDPEIFHAGDKFFNDLFAATRRKASSDNWDKEAPTILVVDDHRMIADSLVEILNISGFRAVVAYDGEAALRIALEMHPDYLLTDVVMPSMNGVELAISVRRSLPETTILLFSGQAGTRDILEQARWEGYTFDLVAKPIHPELLLDYLRKARPR